MKQKILITILLIIIVVLAGIGIWFFSRPSPQGEEKELENFAVASDKDINGIYPKSEAEAFSESVNWEIFSALAEFTKGGKLISDLADYWYNPNDLTWEVYLKKGVKFHDGSEMTAEDVKFSLIDVPQAIEDFYRKESVAMIDKVEIIDSYRIRITTKTPYPVLMNDLSAIAILSKAYIEKNGYDANPIGTGPYKFVKWDKNKEIVLERFEDYYKKKPIAKNVTYKVIPEEAGRIDALIKGEVQFSLQLTLTSIEELEKTAGVKPATTPSVGITFLGIDNRTKTPGINLDKSPLSDPLVRKAIAYGIDKEKIINDVFQKRARIATQVAVPEAFGYNPDIKVYPRDINEAKKLLTEAGYPDGFEVELLAPDDDRAKVAQIIAQQLSDTGIKVTATILPRGEFFDKLFEGQASLFLLTILDETLDAASLATGIFHTATEEYGSLNLVNYSDPKVDELIEKAMSTLDQKARKEYSQEMMRITMEEDLPYIPLYTPDFLSGVRADLEFSERPAGGIALEDLSFAK